jgi:type IV secretory pathway VirB3-like protein
MNIILGFDFWDLFAVFIFMSFVVLLVIYAYIIIMSYILRDKVKMFIDIILSKYNNKRRRNKR